MTGPELPVPSTSYRSTAFVQRIQYTCKWRFDFRDLARAGCSTKPSRPLTGAESRPVSDSNPICLLPEIPASHLPPALSPIGSFPAHTKAFRSQLAAFLLPSTLPKGKPLLEQWQPCSLDRSRVGRGSGSSRFLDLFSFSPPHRPSWSGDPRIWPCSNELRPLPGNGRLLELGCPAAHPLDRINITEGASHHLSGNHHLFSSVRQTASRRDHTR